MDGGTTFHFVTDGLRAAVDRALEEQQRRAELLGRRARRRQQGTRMAVALRLRGDGQRAEHEHVDEPVGCVEPAPRQPDVTTDAAVVVDGDDADAAALAQRVPQVGDHRVGVEGTGDDVAHGGRVVGALAAQLQAHAPSIAGPHATRQPDTPRVEPCSP